MALQTIPDGTEENEGRTRWHECITRYQLPDNHERLINDMKSQLDTLQVAFMDLANASKRLAGAAQSMCNELAGFQVSSSCGVGCAPQPW